MPEKRGRPPKRDAKVLARLYRAIAKKVSRQLKFQRLIHMYSRMVFLREVLHQHIILSLRSIQKNTDRVKKVFPLPTTQHVAECLTEYETNGNTVQRSFYSNRRASIGLREAALRAG